jgi:tyrosyl-tRNA synthetase
LLEDERVNFYSHMKERGLLSQCNDEEGLAELLKKGTLDENGKRMAVYCGFDPTAKSLHIGHLVPLLGLRRAQDFGLQPIILFGGATGLIGDPTGRTDMRPMNTPEQIAGFVKNFAELVKHYFRFDVPNPPIFVNNIDWIGPMTWLQFARDVGVHFTVAKLLSADVNKSRLEHGLTFMEMGYQLLQSFDFLHLARTHNCIMQTGGNDQWSNILGGADLIRRVEHRRAFAFTQPLVLDKSGKKLGKTAGNAIWIDPNMFPVYDFFQYIRNIPDETVDQFFRQYTFLPLDEIRALTAQGANINKAKETLAFEVTKLVHGEAEAQKALDAVHALFSGEGDLSAAPRSSVTKTELTDGLDFLSLMVRTGLCASKGEARRLVLGGGVTINGEKVSDAALKVTPTHFQHECGGMLIRKGKKDYHICTIE